MLLWTHWCRVPYLSIRPIRHSHGPSISHKRSPPLTVRRFKRPNQNRSVASRAVANLVIHNVKNKENKSLEAISRRMLDFSKSLLLLLSPVCFAFAITCLLHVPTSSHFASMTSSAAAKSTGISSAWTGLCAGFLHTLAGPDHLAGLTPLTLGQKQSVATSMGALWGFGHSSGQLLLGLIFLFLKERFDGIVPMLSKWSGTVVGLTLITIGLLGIYESVFQKHDHEESNVHETAAVKGGSITKRGLGTYAMGFIYGLQPDALFVVLPALALPTALATISYVAMFVIGTVCAMAGYTLAIGTASEAAVQNKPWLLRHLSTLAASIAFIVGLFILISNLVNGLPS